MLAPPPHRTAHLLHGAPPIPLGRYSSASDSQSDEDDGRRAGGSGWGVRYAGADGVYGGSLASPDDGTPGQDANADPFGGTIVVDFRPD